MARFQQSVWNRGQRQLDFSAMHRSAGSLACIIATRPRMQYHDIIYGRRKRRSISVGVGEGRNGINAMNRKQRRRAAAGIRSGPRPAEAASTGATAALAAARQYLHQGKLRESEADCRRALAANPKDGYALHLLGVIAGRAGDLKSALTLLRQAVALLPREPAVHLDLGTAHSGLEEYDNALAVYRQALTLNADLLPARKGEANALKALHRFDEAEQSYRRIVESVPSSAESHANLGLVLKELERDREAIAAFEKAVSLDPGLAEAHSALGILLWRQRRYEDALSALHSALKVKADYAEVHGILGWLLLEQHRGLEAEQPFRKLLSLKPDDARAHEGLGMALDTQGRHQEAERHLRKAMAGNQAKISTHRALIDNLAAQDRVEDAHRACELALEQSHDPAELHEIRADLFLQQGRGDDAIATAELALSLDPAGRAGLSTLSRASKLHRNDDVFKRLDALSGELDSAGGAATMHLEFAVSKAYQDVGDDDSAFRHLVAGNRRMRESIYFDGEVIADGFADVAAAYSRELLDRLQGCGVPSDLPVLIVGMPRSGTTLTEQIIASHPNAFGAGELKDLAISTLPLNRPDRPPFSSAELASILTSDSVGEIGRHYVESLRARDPAALRVTDKMPMNFRNLGLAHLALPNARIIHCIRDPVDTCLSCFQQLFKSGNRFTYDLSELGQFYRAYRKLMDHWLSVLPPGRILEVRYEAVVADLDSQARRMIDHCGLPWDDGCLSFHDAERRVRTASVSQVRRPIYRSSVGKWKRYEKHLGPLLDALGDLVAPQD